MANTDPKPTVAVFGATGGTGRHVVDIAVQRGLTPRALVRSAGRLDRPDVEQVVGDVLDTAAVKETLDGADHAVVVLGVRGATRYDDTLSAGTQNIVDAMHALGCDRLVCVTGFGVGESRALAAPPFRFLVLPLLARTYADKERQEERVRGSGLDWTIVRPTHLTNAPRKSGVCPITRRSRWYDAVSRVDVAAFLLDQLSDDRFRGRAVSIGAC